MRLQQLHIRPYRLALKQAWVSATGTFSERRGYLVIAEDDSGQSGYGDCAPLPAAGTESEQTAHAWLNAYRQSFKPGAVEDILKRLPHPQDCPPAARCGLETALLDLTARQHQQPLYRWLDPAASAHVKVNANLGHLSGVTAADILDTHGFSVIKVKVGVEAVEQELDQLQQVCKVLPDGVSLRLDANQAWDTEAAGRFIDAVSGLPIESLEEPVARSGLAQLGILQAQAGFPLALDETLAQYPVDELLSNKPVARLVLKPMLLGGLLPALTLARKARSAGLEAVVTTTLDSAIGTWAATHLAAAVNADGANLHHGLATSPWLMQDVATAPCIRDGKFLLGDTAGLGVQPTT